VSAYYNEFEPYAAQWLRNLIAKNLIAPGEVDERSITDVRADDLAGFTQCHFFAGIAGWSLAARLAGWPDDRELWTGSAPCQPYSVAGKGKGQDDDRDLWPDYFRLIEARRPVVAMGEQVAAAISKHWLDRVFTDMERIGYACESAVVPACAVNAPHRRDRVWFVADAAESNEWRWGIHRPAESGSANCQRTSGESKRRGAGGTVADADSDACRHGDPNARGSADRSRTGKIGGLERADDGTLEHTERARLEGHAGYDGAACGWAQPDRSIAQAGSGGTLANTGSGRCTGQDGRQSEQPGRSEIECASDTRTVADTDQSGTSEERQQRSGQLSGIGGYPWAGAQWIIGHDGKARRVGSRIRRVADGLPAGMAGIRAGSDAEEVEMIPLLAHGVKARVGKLRAFGNAIVPAVAAEVIGAYMDCRP
jgi:DNA (cytosine-5)-methyltransferase 1